MLSNVFNHSLYKAMFPIALILNSFDAIAVPVTLGDAAGYNLFVFNNFTSSSSDSQGAIAVGGNATISAYSVNTLSVGEPAMVVGGSFSQTGGNVNGDVIAGGSYTRNSTASVNGIIKQNIAAAELPVDFSKTYALLNALSLDLSGYGQTAINSGGKMLLTGSGSGQQIFKASESVFESTWGYFAKNITNTQEIIINVAGTTIDVDGDTMMKADNYSWIGNNGHVLYNFYEAKTINIKGALFGSILAPNADVLAFSGTVDGQVIARSWVDANNGAGGTQLNAPLYKHNNQLIPPAAQVPVPAAAWLFGSAIMATVVARKRFSAV